MRSVFYYLPILLLIPICNGESTTLSLSHDSVEIESRRYSCGSNEFDCGQGFCIKSKFQCDGVNDCVEGTDEHNCTISFSSSCNFDAIHCQGGAYCESRSKLDY